MNFTDLIKQRDATMQSWNRLKTNRERDWDLYGYDIGLHPLNMAIGGIIPTRVTVIGGRSGTGKCLAPGTEVLLYNGNLKKVEDIVVGDVLMGPKGPTRVLSTTSGVDMMYEVSQNRGITYRVNSEHILSLSYRGNLIDLPVKEFIKKSNKFKGECKGYRRMARFTTKDQKLDPYFLGLWLGDGKSSLPIIYTIDHEIEQYIYNYASNLPNTVVTTRESKTVRDVKITKRVHGSGVKGPTGSYVFKELKSLNLLNNKHIPTNYLYGDIIQRKRLLAGLIDTDGSVTAGGWEITSKWKHLAEQIQFLCHSLGYRASLSIKHVKTTNYYRVFIYGNDLHTIPVLLERKRIVNSKRIDKRLTGIRVKQIGVGVYYGFTLEEGNRHFLLKDCTVTHNTALTAPMFDASLRFKADGSRLEYLFFTWELDPTIVVDRSICANLGLTLRQLNQGAKLLSEKTMALIRDAYAATSKYPITYHIHSTNIDEVRSISKEFVERCREKSKVEGRHVQPVICIDYLNMAQFEDAGLRTYGISNFMNGLKQFCNVEKAAAIVFAQLSRETDKQGKIPDRSDFSDSASIENAADNLVVLYRPEYHKISTVINPETGLEEDSSGKMLVRVLKGRDYGIGDFLIRCDIKHFRFWDYYQQYAHEYWTDYTSEDFWIQEFGLNKQNTIEQLNFELND